MSDTTSINQPAADPVAQSPFVSEGTTSQYQQFQADASLLTPKAFYEKYGQAGVDALVQENHVQDQILGNYSLLGTRTNTEAATDTIKDVGVGAVTGLTDLAAYLTSPVNKDLSLGISKVSQRIRD